MAEQFRKLGLETILMSPEQFQAFLAAETAKYSDLVRKAVIKSE